VSAPRDAFEVELRAHRVAFVLLTADEVLLAMRSAGEHSLAAAETAIALAGLNESVREIDGQAVTVLDLVTVPLEKRLGTRSLLALANQWAVVHLATPEELERARESIREADDGIHVLLGEREVVLADLTMAEILASTRAADREKTTVARLYAVAMAGAKRAGRGALHLTAKETWILASIWDRLYGAGEPVGEVRAVAGIGSPTPPATATNR